MSKQIIHAKVGAVAHSAIKDAAMPVLGEPNMTALIERFGTEIKTELDLVQLPDGTYPDCDLRIHLIPRRK